MSENLQNTTPETENTAPKARTWTTRDGRSIAPKGVEIYTPEAQAALKPEIWTEAGLVDGEVTDGAEVTVYGMPSVTKVCEYGGKRWAWVHLAQGIKIKVYEDSGRAKALGAEFDAGKFRPVVLHNALVAVRGTLRQVEGGLTVANPWIVTGEALVEQPWFDVEKGLAVVEAFKAAHAAALTTVVDAGQAVYVEANPDFDFDLTGAAEAHDEADEDTDAE